jgi:hypothetical protein
MHQLSLTQRIASRFALDFMSPIVMLRPCLKKYGFAKPSIATKSQAMRPFVQPQDCLTASRHRMGKISYQPITANISRETAMHFCRRILAQYHFTRHRPSSVAQTSSADSHRDYRRCSIGVL